MAVKRASEAALKKDDFVPLSWLKNAHLMTIAPAFLPRGAGLRKRAAERVLIPVAEHSEILAICHFHADFTRHPTVVLVHGLEGSAESFYIAGLAEKALAAGFNAVRLNLRNCGDTLHLTPTLYNAGMSEDILKVVEFLAEKRGLTDLFLVGYSLGGNLVLKASAELGHLVDHVSGTVGISPPIDLDACVTEMEKSSNRIYELTFLWSLKNKIRQKNKLYPKSFAAEKLALVKSVREFDDVFTAVDGNYGTAERYYRVASSKPLLGKVRVPTLVIAAQDDPLVPFSVFEQIETEFVQLLAPKYGGHAGFVQELDKSLKQRSTDDHFWADGQILDFCSRHSKLLKN